MACRIAINGRADDFVAATGESLLDAGRRAGFSFPHACRNGNCFRCEGRLLQGEVEHLRSHERIVGEIVGGACPAEAGPTAGPTGDGVPILPCIVAARSDCVLMIEGVYGPGEMPVVDVTAQVVAVELLNQDVARVHLRLPAGKPVARLAGQYLEILDTEKPDPAKSGGATLPTTDDAESVYAFSIASPPESGRDIELHIRSSKDNPSSLRVMALLQRGAVVTVRLPQGDCTLIAEPRLPLLLVAGATGFSQAKAFIEHAIAQHWTVPITLYWGVRTPDDFYLAALPLAWARDHPNIRYVPVVSDTAHPVGTHNHHTGLVHEAVLADMPDFSGILVYACGSPPMVYAAHDAFVARGLPPERMFSDVFAWAPRPAR